jgi:hypothetical protein
MTAPQRVSFHLQQPAGAHVPAKSGPNAVLGGYSFDPFVSVSFVVARPGRPRWFTPQNVAERKQRVGHETGQT